MRKTNPEQIMNKWKEAFRQANHKEPPHIEHFNGWYRINFSKSKLRGKQIQEMINNLMQRETVK